MIAEGARIPLFQRVTRDRKRKDEKGTEVDLKAGDIMQNSMVVPGRWWRVPQTLDTINAIAVAITTNSLATRRRCAQTTRRGATSRPTTTNWRIAMTT